MSANTGTLAVGQSAWTPRFNPWLIAVVVSLGAFMEVLDTSIANVALPHIAGNLAASTDESTWVLTSYLVSNAIILPLTGWLVGVLGRKRFFLICITLFTASSFLCGIAPSLGVLLFARVVQGAGGGGLQPMAQAILADSFPPQKRGAAFAVFAVSVIFAPAIGPTLGGWITDSYTWRWIFLINLPVGLITLVLVSRMIDDPPFLKRLTGARFDYIGVSLLALGIGALQVMLDRGQEDDWFASHFITTLGGIAFVCITALVFWELRYRQPIVDIRLFKSANFANACIMIFFMGAVSFSGTVLMPQFLQTLLGYSAETAGMALSLGALVMFVVMPVVGRLTSHMQARYLIAFGWFASAASMFLSAKTISLTMSFPSASWLRVFQSFPTGFIFIPATMAAYIGLPPEKSNAIAGLVNFMRNMGSSVGTSMVTTLLVQRAQVHQSMLANHTSLSNPGFRNAVNGLALQLNHSGLSMAAAQRQALARMYAMVVGQSSAIAYVDVYWLIAVGAAIMFFLAFGLKKNALHKGTTITVH